MATTLQSHARRVLAHQATKANGNGDHGETAQTEPAPDTSVAPDPSFVAGLTHGVKIRRRVTVAVLPFPEDSAIICRVIEEIHESKIEGDTRFGGTPASVCQVEAPNGEVRILIAGKVLKTELEKNYPKGGYVGLWFHIAKLRRPDKNYSDYAITEIEPPTWSVET